MRLGRKMFRLIFCAVFGVLVSCKELKPNCEELQKKQLLMLLDVSDEELYETIETDVASNFSKFMSESPFKEVNECEVFKLSIGSFSAIDELTLAEAQIGITKKGISGKEKRQLSNPKPLISLLKNSLANFKSQSTNEEFNNSTNLTLTIVKAILGMDDDAENTLLISSDLIVNNRLEKINFYKKVPTDVSETIRTLIDADMKQKLTEKLASMYQLKVIVVQKSEPQNRVDKKEVKAFWLKTFEEFGIEDVQFVDNLTNKVVWD